MDPRTMSDLDQSVATDLFPTLWRGLYMRLMEEGFTDVQAFELVKTYILASCRSSS